jgi:predicted HTH transcriptional regulator
MMPVWASPLMPSFTICYDFLKKLVIEEGFHEPSPVLLEDKILAYVRENGSIGNAECQTLLGIDNRRAWYLLTKLAKSGLLSPNGSGKGRRYSLSSS